MPKKFLKRFLPDHETIKSHPSLKILGDTLHHPNLWHLTRHSVVKAVSIGFFVSFIPIPGHMILAALLSILMHANVTIAVALVWISNPITMGPMYYLAYRVGIAILGHPEKPFHIEMTLRWFVTEVEIIAAPLFLGAILCGLVFALLGNMTLRILWRCSVSQSLRKRQRRRLSSPS